MGALLCCRAGALDGPAGVEEGAAAALPWSCRRCSCCGCSKGWWSGGGWGGAGVSHLSLGAAEGWGGAGRALGRVKKAAWAASGLVASIMRAAELRAPGRSRPSIMDGAVPLPPAGRVAVTACAEAVDAAEALLPRLPSAFCCCWGAAAVVLGTVDAVIAWTARRCRGCGANVQVLKSESRPRRGRLRSMFWPLQRTEPQRERGRRRRARVAQERTPELCQARAAHPRSGSANSGPYC